MASSRSREHVAWFGLRSNAQSLLAGRPIVSVRQRLKLASLFSDQVLLESGARVIHAGPAGSTSLRHAISTMQQWQSTRDRGGWRKSGFELGLDGQVMLESPAEIAWEAPFEPFKAELRGSCAAADRPKALLGHAACNIGGCSRTMAC